VFHNILEKLGIEPVSRESFEILVSSINILLNYTDRLESLLNWDAPILPKEKRKRFGIYYTIEQGTKLMVSVIENFLSPKLLVKIF